MTSRLLTQKGQELVNSNRELGYWTSPGQDSPYNFVGDFYHEGVDLSASEVLSIQAHHVYSDAQVWAADWNQNNPDELLFFAGIDFEGPIAGQWWETKGRKPNPPFGSGERYHKFGGNGAAKILTVKR